ncbi:MAG TPA: hypothetical protein VGO14_00210 [Solirubrobacteraceae bacterium]|jgi:hypothetical protein|nr:hypothetical protein [Solirubrobacteraceae bacterium]
MRRSAIVLLGWGTLLGLMTALQAPFGPHVIEYAMLGVASAASLLVGLALASMRARRAEGALAVADESIATATLVSGLAMALLGAGFGLWLILIGAGVSGLGLGGVLREGRARRDDLERRGTGER